VLNQGGKSYFSGSRNAKSGQDYVIHIGNKLDLFRHVLSTRLFDNHGLSSKKATKKFIQSIEDIQPEIIHLHNIHGYYLHVGVLFDFLKSSKTPVVWTLHDCWPFTGHCAYFDRVDCQKWKTQCHTCPLKSYYPKSYFKDNSKNNFLLKREFFTGLENLTICTPSHWLKGLIEESFLKEYPVEVIHNGIDLEVFQSKINAKKRTNEPIRVLGVANIWDARKGLDDFIELNNRLEGEIKITLVGVSDKVSRKLPSEIRSLERTNNVNELVDLYQEADVFINPTYSDNFPTTNIEALACGTPVITYDTGGSPEAIDDVTGICVRKGDVEGLVSAIQRINENPNIFSVDACSSRAQNNFNKDENFLAYIELYKQLLN
jgi:glycosyltransferase involved in cell wall biosynthesis